MLTWIESRLLHFNINQNCHCQQMQGVKCRLEMLEQELQFSVETSIASIKSINRK